MCMCKIGVIGDRDSVLGFKALGISVFPVTDPRQAGKLIHKLAREGYAVLFITETVAEEIEESIERYSAEPFPVIISIPNNQGSTGLGIRRIKESVEKAVGIDILFEKRG